ncbi:hypothetical protein LOC67_07395 [Stieleria sp. JC731]|nr:hypothetical protein [Stieleria sp. JC731]
MLNQNPEQQVEAIFRRLLHEGKPVALEDATKLVSTEPGFDRRIFGQIPQRMLRDGEIVEVGFRRSESAKHNSGIKRLWVLTEYASDYGPSGLEGDG